MALIHDILMYQVKSTFSCSPAVLTEEESDLLVSSKTVIALMEIQQNPM